MENTKQLKENNDTDKLDINITAGKLLKFALPSIIAMIMMNVYGVVDGIFISNLIDTKALSSLNFVSPMFGVVFAVSMMLGTGATAIVAKKLGEGKGSEARQNFTLIVLVSLGLGLLFTALGYIFIEPLIHFLGVNEGAFETREDYLVVYGYCYDYMIVFLAFLAGSFLNIVIYSFLIAAGHARMGLILTTAGGLFNIVFDYVFIAPAGMGISGAALATGIGYSIPPIFGLLYFTLFRRGDLFFVKPKFDGRMLVKSCGNGASEMIGNLSNALVIFLFNQTLMKFAGEDGVAAITIILYAMNLLIAAYFGYVMGISPLISYNHGKQDTGRLKRTFKISLLVIGIASATVFAISMIFAEGLVSLFASGSAAVAEMAVRGYRLFAICFLFMGFNVFSSAMFTAFNDGRTSAILSVLRTLVFIVAAILILPLIFGIDGVWIAMPIAEFLALGVTIFFFIRKKKVYNYV